MKRRAKKIGTGSPCPCCGGPKGKRRVEIVVRANRRAPFRMVASRSVTVCGKCGDGVFDTAVATLPGKVS